MRIKFLLITLLASLVSVAAHASGTGLGTAVLTPTSVVEGSVVTATVTYIVPAGGMSTGGRLQIFIPVNWGPYLSTVPGNNGYVSITSTNTATFTIVPSSSSVASVLITVVSGSLTAGVTVTVSFNNLFANCPQPGNNQINWEVQSAMTSTDALGDLVTAPSSESYAVGNFQYLSFVPWSVLTVVAGQPSGALVLQPSDGCGQSVVLGSSLTVSLHGLLVDQTNTDPGASFSTSSIFASTTTSIVLPAASSTTAFYYKTSTPGNNLWLRGDYTNPVNSFAQQAWRQVNSLSSTFVFNNPSVDNGTQVNGQTSMTFSPDGDGINDFAFIRFSPSDTTLQWHVTISSDGFANVVYEQWGSGNPQSSLVWDGHDRRNGTIDPNGTYTIKLEVPGLTPNTTLSVVLNTSQISGTVTLGGAPVSKANVNAFPTSGSGYANAMTATNGSYTLYGLRAGTSYNLFVSFLSTQTQANITGNLNNVIAPATSQNFALASPGILRVAVAIPSAAASTVSGNLNLFIANSQQNYGGNIRLLAGTTTSDNGDPFNPSTWTILGIAPGTYTMHLSLAGYGIADQPVTVTANTTTSLLLHPTPQASIYGKITLPVAAAANEWVSVQMTPAGSSIPTAFGGASFNVGQSTAIYSIYAVAAGTYTITAQIPNLVPLQLTNVIVGTANLGNSVSGGEDFNGFTIGGQISGTLTVNGDTSAQPNPFTLWVNAYNPTLGLNGFTQIQLTTSTTSTQTTYSIGGLANGTYQIFPPYLPGFDTSPPGAQSVTVSGNNGTLNLVVNQNTGQISGNIILPGGRSDYSNVHLSLQGPASKEIDLAAGPSYSIPNLNTGFYSLVATYLFSGAQVSQNVAVTNGQTQAINIDLSAPTFNASGSVTVQSGFSMLGTSGSIVAVNTISDLLNDATTQVLILGGVPGFSANSNVFGCVGGVATTTTTARVEAFPKNFNNYNQSNRSGFANCFGVGQYKYGTIQADGSYSISGLYPGLWEIDVYPYFDNGASPDVAVLKQTISITNADANLVNFSLSAGNNVSGTLTLPSGITDTHTFNLQIVTDRGDTVETQAISIGSQGNPAASADFTIPHLAAGSYSLLAVDPGVMDTTGRNVITYVSQPLQINVTGGDLTGENITLATASRIIGKLAIQGTNPDGTPSLTLITPTNSNLLSSNFSINAQANPWVPGGSAQASFGTTGSIGIDANNQFSIDGLVAGTYDINFQQFSYGTASQGSLNLAAYTQGGVSVPLSQTIDLGTITLVPGISLSGTVTDAAGHALSNIRVRAQPSNSQHGSDSLETFTNANGLYSFAGLNPSIKTYDFTAAPRPSPGENVLAVPYGQVKRLAIDVTLAPTLNFTLPSATASLTGKILTADGNPLSFPDSDQQGYPAAAVYVFLHGDTTVDNPLGNENATALDGSFSIPYLQSGVYDITIESLGYKPVKLSNVTLVDNTNKDLGTTTLQTGPSLTATLAKPDGSAVNTKDVQTAVAASGDLGSIIFGQVNSDSKTGNILSVKFAGFDLAPKNYTVLFFDSRNNVIIPPEGKNLQFTANTDILSKSLTFTPTAPVVLASVQKAGANVSVTFYFSRPLRNGPTDLTPSSWLSLVSAQGSISGVTLSGDRRQMQFLYTPAAGELHATLLFSAHTVDVDPSTGVEFVISKTLTLLLGQKATSEQNINPALGGSVSLSDNQDPTNINISANSFLNTNGTAADATTSYALTLTATDDAASVGAGALKGAARVNGMMAMGAGAYVSEAYQAMQSAKALASVNPLSSFYSVLLPAGLSHTLNQTAFLTLTYDTNADPSKINVYFFNGSEYLIQNNLRTVDPVNHTITVGVSHFSTFVVLENNAPVVVVGETNSVGTIEVFNFPNPFDLQPKTKTLNRGGSTTSLSTDGTIIRYSIPAAMAGAAHIDIYDVVGEKVRSIDLGTPAADTVNYVTWDGKNDSAKKVASGVYIGELKVGGQKAFWKMAVIK